MAKPKSDSPKRPSSARPNDPPRRGWLSYLVRLVIFFGLTGTVAASMVLLGIYFYYAPTLPAFHSLADYHPKVGTRIYSSDNQVIGEFAAERRVLVDYDQVPPLLFQAFISAEDKRFWEHGGVDFLGMAQAAFDKVRKGGKLRGASTITQQAAKSLLAINESYESATERSFERKIREALLAIRLEQALTKKQILYIYVNQIFLGYQAYGVQAAAEHYFRKNVWELSLAEMATFAGLPQRPSDYSPVSNPEKALARRKYVLRRMLEDGAISQEQHDKAAAEVLVTYPREELYLAVAPYYTEQVRRDIIERYGEREVLEEGLEVYTAVSLELQANGQAALDHGLRDLDKRQGFRGPLGNVEKGKRDLFKQKYRAYLGLKDNAKLQMKEGKSYVGLVTNVQSTYATLDVAGTQVYMPLAAVRWARKPNPLTRMDAYLVTDVKNVLSAGDIVQLRPTNRQWLTEWKYGSNVSDAVPTDGPLVRLEQEPLAQGALFSTEPRSGYVLAQIGGYNFVDSSYNRAVQACREPGSAFKPIVYSAAIDKLDMGPGTIIDDKPIVFDDADAGTRWKPDNFEEEFKGEILLRSALRDSINSVAVRLADMVGIHDVNKNARRLGITTPLKAELGTALGSSCTTLYDLMNVYVAFNQLGERRDMTFVRRVVDRYGNVLEDHTVAWDPTLDLASRLTRAYNRIVTPPRMALDRQTAFLITNMLKGVVDGGTGAAASRLGVPAAGKTGTTNDSYDAWFMAFTRNLVTGVWVGHDKKERPLGPNEQGGRTALPIWLEFMMGALTDYTTDPPSKKPSGSFPMPSGIVQISIDPESGMRARAGGRAYSEYFRAGSEPREVAPDKNVVNAGQDSIFSADTPL